MWFEVLGIHMNCKKCNNTIFRRRPCMYQKCPDWQHRTRPNRMYCRRGRWTLGDLQWAGWGEFWWPHWDPSRSCSQTQCRCRQSFSGWTIEMVCIPVDPLQTQLFFGLRDRITSAKKKKKQNMKCRQLLSTSCIHNQDLEIWKLMVDVKRWPRICATQVSWRWKRWRTPSSLVNSFLSRVDRN